MAKGREIFFVSLSSAAVFGEKKKKELKKMTNRLLIIPVGFIAVLFLAALLLAGSYMLQNFERLNFSTHSDHRDRLNGLLEKLDRDLFSVEFPRLKIQQVCFEEFSFWVRESCRNILLLAYFDARCVNSWCLCIFKLNIYCGKTERWRSFCPLLHDSYICEHTNDVWTL